MRPDSRPGEGSRTRASATRPSRGACRRGHGCEGTLRASRTGASDKWCSSNCCGRISAWARTRCTRRIKQKKAGLQQNLWVETGAIPRSAGLGGTGFIPTLAVEAFPTASPPSPLQQTTDTPDLRERGSAHEARSNPSYAGLPCHRNERKPKRERCPSQQPCFDSKR